MFFWNQQLNPKSDNWQIEIDPTRIKCGILKIEQIGKLIDLLSSDFIEITSPATAFLVRIKLEDVLIELLYKVTPTQNKDFTDSRRNYLHTLLFSGRNDLVLAVLFAIEIIKDTSAQKHLQYFISGFKGVDEIELKQKSQQCLKKIENKVG